MGRCSVDLCTLLLVPLCETERERERNPLPDLDLSAGFMWRNPLGLLAADETSPCS